MAGKPRVKLNSPGVLAILNDDGVRGYLEELAARVADAAKATAPVRSGEYRDSIDYGSATTDRAVGRVYASSAHALVVEARTGNLARSLDAAGGA